MGEVQLSITQSPLTVSQFLAYPLVVLLGFQECLPWFHSNYIQLEYFKDTRGESLSFVGGWVADIQWIRFQYIEKKHFIESTNDINRSIKDFINDGWYFYSIFDEFYIPNRGKFNKIHFSFDFLIYGYDDKAQEYSVLGYSNKGIFEATKIGYGDFIKAFESVFEYQPFVILYKKREDFSFEFNFKYFYDMLYDYIYSQNTAARLEISQRKEIKNRIFGLDTYYCLIKYFQMVRDKHGKDNMLLYRTSRSLHGLWEHKKCMLLRLEYLNQHNLIEKFEYFYNFYQKIENDVLILRNLHLQYSLTKDHRLLEQITNSLLEIRNLESKVLEDMLELTRKRMNQMKNSPEPFTENKNFELK